MGSIAGASPRVSIALVSFAFFDWLLLLAVGEGLIILWLLVKAVDAERWHEQARANRCRLSS
jgi:hypothetical protein